MNSDKADVDGDSIGMWVGVCKRAQAMPYHVSILCLIEYWHYFVQLQWHDKSSILTKNFWWSNKDFIAKTLIKLTFKLFLTNITFYWITLIFSLIFNTFSYSTIISFLLKLVKDISKAVGLNELTDEREKASIKSNVYKGSHSLKFDFSLLTTCFASVLLQPYLKSIFYINEYLNRNIYKCASNIINIDTHDKLIKL